MHNGLKAKEMKAQNSLIEELMLYQFKVNNNAVKATKNICCAKGEDAVDPQLTNQIVQEILFRLQGS